MREAAGRGYVSAYWDDLAVLMSDPDYFSTLFELDPNETLRAWAALEGNSRHRVAVVYAAAIRDPEAAAYGPGLAELLSDRGKMDEAASLLHRLVDRARGHGDPRLLAAALRDLVRIPIGISTRSENLELLRLSRQLGDAGALAEALCHEAWSRWFDGLFDEDPQGEIDSRRLLQEQHRLCRRHGDKHGLALWADARAWLSYFDGYPLPMSRLLAVQEQLLRGCGDLRLLCACLLHRARILRVSPATQADAWEKMQEAEDMARDLGLHRMVSAALTDQGVTALLEGDETRAGEILSVVQSGSIDPESPLERALRQALRFPGGAHLGADDDGRGFVEMAERVARELGDAGAVQWALGHLEGALEESDAEAALAVSRERESICRDLGRWFDLQETLRREAALLVRLHEPIAAVAVLKDAVCVCGEHGLEWCIDDLRKAQRDALRGALHECGDAEAAIALQVQLELVLRGLHDRAGASKAVRDQARLLRMLHRRTAEPLPMDPAQLSLDV